MGNYQNKVEITEKIGVSNSNDDVYTTKYSRTENKSNYPTVSKLEIMTTFIKNSSFVSNDLYTTKYSCTENKCNFELALIDIGKKYPQYQSMVKQIAEHQDIVSAHKVKNIVLHDDMDHLVVLHHDGGEQHEYNAYVRVDIS